MKFDIKDIKYKNYAIYFDGKLQKSAIEANDELGWVKTEEYLYFSADMNYNSITKTKYGKIHIVKMIDIPMEEYRDIFILVKYNNILEHF